jgi:hypothetical protein
MFGILHNDVVKKPLATRGSPILSKVRRILFDLEVMNNGFGG